MEILPAIDLLGGAVVRLSQGRYDQPTVYSSDPGAVAEQFVRAGARWIHVVDLDAARTGRRTNAAAIEAICRRSGVSVELGGGIRDDDAVQAALNLGVARVVVGSAAIANWGWFEQLAARADLAGRIALGLDARGQEVRVHGWTQGAGTTVADVARRSAALPLAAIVYTDVARDGMLTGPNLDATREVMALSGRPVVASGGISGIEDIAACKRVGCAGAIVGRAYYEGRIDLSAACRLAAQAP